MSRKPEKFIQVTSNIHSSSKSYTLDSKIRQNLTIVEGIPWFRWNTDYKLIKSMTVEKMFLFIRYIGYVL